MVTRLGTVEKYTYKNHCIKIKQEHYNGDKQVTFKAIVEGVPNITIRDYGHRHEGVIGAINLNLFRRLLTSDYAQQRVKELKEKTENEIDKKTKLKNKLEEKKL